MARKMKKFAEGGDPDMDAANDIANESFGAAFKRNRAAGNKTFEWHGKKYTTEMAKPKAESKPNYTPKQTTVSGKPKETGMAYGADFSGPGRAARAANSVYGADWENAKGMKKGGSVSSASKRADGCAMKGKTRGKFV